MRKLILLPLACLGFLMASAQSVSSASASPGVTAPAVNGTASVNVTLYNAIEISPPMQWTYTTIFQSANDYNGLTGASDMGEQTWFIKSTKPGKVSLTFTDLMSPPPNATVMPVGKMSYSTDGGSSWGTATYSVPTAMTFGSGDNTLFKLKLKLNPGWNYRGGIYAGYLIVTATQL